MKSDIYKMLLCRWKRLQTIKALTMVLQRRNILALLWIVSFGEEASDHIFKQIYLICLHSHSIQYLDIETVYAFYQDSYVNKPSVSLWSEEKMLPGKLGKFIQDNIYGWLYWARDEIGGWKFVEINFLLQRHVRISIECFGCSFTILLNSMKYFKQIEFFFSLESFRYLYPY